LRIAALAGVLLSSLLAPICASAALGGDVVSVKADQQEMRATRAVQANEKYSVHEITTPYGTVVREYVSPDGKVFGVAWRGPFLPDLQQLLGSYYAQFVQGAQDAKAAEPDARAICRLRWTVRNWCCIPEGTRAPMPDTPMCRG